MAHLDAACKRGSHATLRGDVVRKDGTTAPISWKLVPQQSPCGQVEAIALVGTDITEVESLQRQLSTVERHAKTFTDSLPGIAFIKDRTRRLVYISKQFEEVFECTNEQGLGRRDEDYLPRAVARRNKAIEERLIKSGGSYVQIEEDEAVSGGKRWLILRYTEGEGSQRQIVGLSIDISALTEAEERFRAFSEASSDAIAILRPLRDSRGKVEDFAFTYTNELAKGVYQLENAGRDFKHATQNLLPSHVLPALIRVVETGIPFETELCIGVKPNEESWYQLKAFRAGDFIGLDLRDISVERIALKRSLLASHRFKSLFDGNPAACMTLDLAGNVVDWNRQCTELYGYTEAEVKGKSIIDLVVGAETRKTALDAHAETTQQGGTHEGSEWCVKRKDGKSIWVFSSTIPLLDESGELAGMVSSNIDITALKQTEAALRASNSDLEQFANVASHDLLEPLRMVCCYMDLLESQYGDLLDSEGKQFLRFALDGGLRMREMIKNLLEFSQVGKERTSFEPVPARLVVQEALENLHVALQEHPTAKIEVGDLPDLLGNKLELVRLFQNLVANSVKFRSGEPLTIEISAQERVSGIEFAVKDNGIGIDPRFRDKVFKLFQRLHHRADYDGCGIGLSVCKKIVERHGGEIWVADTERGCEIRLLLPDQRCDTIAVAA